MKNKPKMRTFVKSKNTIRDYKMSEEQTEKTSNFIRKAQDVHSHYYDYSNTIVRGCEDKVEIRCPVHGSFYTRPRNHLYGNGCPTCAKSKNRKPKNKQKNTNPKITVTKNYIVCKPQGNHYILKGVLEGKDVHVKVDPSEIEGMFEELFNSFCL